MLATSEHRRANTLYMHIRMAATMLMGKDIRFLILFHLLFFKNDTDSCDDTYIMVHEQAISFLIRKDLGLGC